MWLVKGYFEWQFERYYKAASMYIPILAQVLKRQDASQILIVPLYSSISGMYLSTHLPLLCSSSHSCSAREGDEFPFF